MLPFIGVDTISLERPLIKDGFTIACAQDRWVKKYMRSINKYLLEMLGQHTKLVRVYMEHKKGIWKIKLPYFA